MLRRSRAGVAWVIVVQAHAPSAKAELNVAEFAVLVVGEPFKLWMFIRWLPFSGRSFVVASAHKSQEAFFALPVLAFDAFWWGAVRSDPLRQSQACGVAVTMTFAVTFALIRGGVWEESADKPDSVPLFAQRWRPSLCDDSYLPPGAAYPGSSDGPPDPCSALLPVGHA